MMCVRDCRHTCSMTDMWSVEVKENLETDPLLSRVPGIKPMLSGLYSTGRRWAEHKNNKHVCLTG